MTMPPAKHTGTHGTRDDSTDEEITIAMLLGWRKVDGAWTHDKYCEHWTFATNAIRQTLLENTKK